MPFWAQMEPICHPFGPQKSTKTQQVPFKGPLFAPSQKHLQFHRFLDPPEPSESSSRVHKTSIFTFWPYPQNRLQSTSQNLPFGHLWAPKPPKVRKMNAPENTLKNRYAKIPKICQNDLPKSWLNGPETLFFPSLVPNLLPRGHETPKYLFFLKNDIFFLLFRTYFWCQVSTAQLCKSQKNAIVSPCFSILFSQDCGRQSTLLPPISTYPSLLSAYILRSYSCTTPAVDLKYSSSIPIVFLQ